MISSVNLNSNLINKTMTKEQLFLEIDEIYSEWHGGDLHIGQERENLIKQVIEKAINYTQCCE
jgi:hypothetical protein